MTQPTKLTRRFLKASNESEAVLGTASFKKDGKFTEWPVVKIGYSSWPLDEFDELVAFVNEEKARIQTAESGG